MDRNKIAAILNEHVFSDDKVALLKAIASNPDRYVGVFRSTSPELKLMQNLLQSREIRFGDALEKIVRGLLEQSGYEFLPARFSADLAFDHYLRNPKNNMHFLIEQKVRDDHDSTKKRGQIENLRRKIDALLGIHPSYDLTVIMYFIDPSLRKNENYYLAQISSIASEYEITAQLFYNGELFQFFQGDLKSWELLLDALSHWRKTIPHKLSLDFDQAADETAVLLAHAISARHWTVILNNDALWTTGLMKALFPSGESLKKISRIWNNSTSGFEKVLATKLSERIAQAYHIK